ncbi:MAG: hypothetical protein FJZ87_14370 [Chloroflexi bacterium]|nr:hypothetical protein [Chloroflexota bacterium]
MFDNLREDLDPNRDQGEAKLQPATNTVSGSIAPRPSRFLGMTSGQRFVIAVMLMVAVIVLGSMCLLVAGKIAL